MEFRFWKKDRNSVQPVKSASAEKEVSGASSSPNTDREVSSELQAEIDRALQDVKLSGAETLRKTFYDVIGSAVGQIAEFSNEVRGGKIMELYASKVDNDHLIIAMGDGSAISIKITASTIQELDEAEGKR